MRKFVTVISNAKNKPDLKLSLGCTLRMALEIKPQYLSLAADADGFARDTLTITSRKKDLIIKEVVFEEREQSSNKAASWQKELPMLVPLATRLVKSNKKPEDGYHEYRLFLSLVAPERLTTYGKFTFKTNYPEKQEVILKGVLRNNNGE